jgi:hypothetical protein
MRRKKRIRTLRGSNPFFRRLRRLQPRGIVHARSSPSTARRSETGRRWYLGWYSAPRRLVLILRKSSFSRAGEGIRAGATWALDALHVAQPRLRCGYVRPAKPRSGGAAPSTAPNILQPRRTELIKKAAGGGLFLEREKGFEPSTSTLARWHSTTELLPQFGLGRIAFDPGCVKRTRAFGHLPSCHGFAGSSPSAGVGVGRALPPFPGFAPFASGSGTSGIEPPSSASSSTTVSACTAAARSAAASCSA